MTLSHAPNDGLITIGQTEPDGLAQRVISGHQGRKMEAWERLRRSADFTDLDSYGVPELARKSFATAMMDYLYTDLEQLWDKPCEGLSKTPENIAYAIGTRFSELCSMFDNTGVESPIEQQLGPALLWMEPEAGLPSVDCFGGPESSYHTAMPGCKDINFWITPQAKVCGYKVDFLVWMACGNHRAGVSIECDGHAFHEKTKEQAAKDKKRDRTLLTAGFPVMRFSGSEIYNNVMSCKAQVEEPLSDVFFRIARQGGLI